MLSVGQTTNNFRQVFLQNKKKSLGRAEQSKNEPKQMIVNNLSGLVLYENPTQSDMDFLMDTDWTSFPSSAPSTSSSTASDAQSAPPDLDQLFHKICDEYSRCVHEAGRVLPPEWTMPDLVRTILGDEAIQHGFLTDAYYDVMLCGTHSWGCEELLNLLDLIHYVF